MDSNKYRKKTEGYRQGYLRSALSDREVCEFLDKYNVRKERRCYVCGCNFISPGAHIHRCPKCTAKHKLNEDNQIRFDMPVHRMSGKFRSTHHFIGEID